MSDEGVCRAAPGFARVCKKGNFPDRFRLYFGGNFNRKKMNEHCNLIGKIYILQERFPHWQLTMVFPHETKHCAVFIANQYCLS